MSRNVTTCIGHPRAGARCSREAHGFGKCLVDIASLDPQQRAVVSRIGIHCRLVRPVDFDDCAKFAFDVRPPAVLRAAPAKIVTECFILVDEIVEPNRLMRRSNDRRHRCRVLRPETLSQQIFKITQGNSAIDCASRRERYDQGIGAACRSLRLLRRALNPGKALLQRRNSSVFAWRLRSWRTGWRGSDDHRPRSQVHRTRARYDAKKARGWLIMSEAPDCRTGSHENENQRNQ